MEQPNEKVPEVELPWPLNTRTPNEAVRNRNPANISLDEGEDPLTWSPIRKWISTIIVLLMTGTIAFCSSIYTAAIQAIAEDFNVSRTISTLGVTTFLLGFSSGPLLFAPLSEVWGRKRVYRITLLLFVIFQIACALSPNITALLLFRFFSGFFGSPTVTNSGGSLTDIWPSDQRSVPFALFTAASFLGPVLAPVAGGFLTEYTSWRWNFYLLLIMSGVVYVPMVLFLPETYAPKLLIEKAIRYGYNLPKQSFRERYQTILTRPWIMLFTEPILFLLSLYMAFIFGILYLDFTAYPIVFGQSRHWSTGQSGLSFLGIGLGMMITTILSPYINKIHSYFVRKIGTVPEARLPHLIILSWFIPLGLFWFAWTAQPSHHFILPILAGIPFGIGLVALFLGIVSYLTDCYGIFSASALAANAVLRSLFGAVFPLFARIMFARLGTPWAVSLLGFCALAMAPLPWVFYKYGPLLRSKSAFHLRTVTSAGVRS